MKLRYKLIALIALWTWFLWYCGLFSHKTPVTPHVLPVNDTEQILVNPVTHQLTIITAHGSQVVTLPDHVSVIDVHTNGTVKVTAPQFGREIRPFVGAFYSNKLRFGGGADFVYWKRLDLGLGVAGGSGAVTVLFPQLSYTVWDNVHVGITYDTQQYVGVGITVRI